MSPPPSDVAVRLELVPVSRDEARAFVRAHHRHSPRPPTGWRFGVGLHDGLGDLVGVAMIGRPTGRGLDQRRSVEITRVCVLEGNRNACSRLYGAACRAAAALGYRTAYTYTLDEEDAASVRAAGFVLDAELPGRTNAEWASRARYEENLLGERERPEGPKRRWRRDL